MYFGNLNQKYFWIKNFGSNFYPHPLLFKVIFIIYFEKIFLLFSIINWVHFEIDILPGEFALYY